MAKHTKATRFIRAAARTSVPVKNTVVLNGKSNGQIHFFRPLWCGLVTNHQEATHTSAFGVPRRKQQNMFGGLDLKGGSGSEKKKEEAPQPAPASAFSFLSPTSNEAPAPKPATSSFSFLNGGGSAASVDAVDRSKEGTGTPSQPAATEAVPPTAAASPFDFLLQPSAETTAGSLVKDSPPAPVPLVVESSAKSVGSSAGELSLPETNGDTAAPSILNTANPNSGIMLSGTAVKKTVKKRTRTSRIGAGAQSMPTSVLPPPPPLPSIPKPPPPTETPSSLNNAAMEATRKAEQFMKEKSFEIPAIASMPSEEDDVIVAAKAAAAEAQQMQQRTSSGRFKGLFRSRSPQTARPTLTSSTSSVSAGSATSSKPAEPEKSTPPPLIVQAPAPVRSSPPTMETITIPKVTAAPPPDVLSTFLPKVETPTEKFSKLLTAFSDHVKTHMDHMGQLRLHKSALEAERLAAAAKQRWSQAELEQAEAQQQAAVDVEDFERADELGSTIAKHQAAIQEAGAIVQNIAKALAEIEQQNADAINTVTSSFDDIRTKLEAFEETEVKDESDQEAKSVLEKFSETSKQLSAENERLRNDKKHLEKDEELVVAERKELEEAITEQSGEYEKLRDEARAKLEQTEAEMEDLRKQLQEKQKLAARLRTDAAGHDESVLKVRVKFARQINRVQKKEMSIKDNKEEWESEKSTFEQMKEQHEALVQAHSERLLAREKLLESLKTQVDLSTSLQDVVKECLKVDASDVAQLSSDPQLEEDVVARRAALSKCQYAVDTAKEAISTLEKEITFLKAEIPALEETKKDSAKRKDFKAASKASKDIKQASSRLTEAHGELSEAQSSCESAEASCRTAQSELEASQQIALASEKDAAETAVGQLAAQLKVLQASLEQIGTDQDSLSGVSSAASYCLESQMTALCKQGMELVDKYRINGFESVFVVATQTRTEEAPNTTSLATGASQHPPLETIPSEAEVDMGDECSPAPAVAQETPMDMNRVSEFLRCSTQLQELVAQQEEAAAAEDYDTAAELEDKIHEVTQEIEAMNLTDAEMDRAMAMDSGDVQPTVPDGASAAPEEAQDTVRVDAVETDEVVEAPPVQDTSECIDRSDDIQPPERTENGHEETNGQISPESPMDEDKEQHKDEYPPNEAATDIQKQDEEDAVGDLEL